MLPPIPGSDGPCARQQVDDKMVSLATLNSLLAALIPDQGN